MKPLILTIIAAIPFLSCRVNVQAKSNIRQLDENVEILEVEKKDIQDFEIQYFNIDLEYLSELNDNELICSQREIIYIPEKIIKADDGFGFDKEGNLVSLKDDA